jgi:Ca-activated chloride channel family protein
LEDVEENVYNKYNKLMYTIATDVKAQIEFNPKYVKSYRLI